MRDDAGALVNLGQQHQAIDAGPFDACGMVKRRPDPRFRFPDDGWRNRHPMLASWYEEASRLPGMQATKPA